MTEHTLFGIMPYLKTSDTVKVRGISFCPSQRLNENDKINDDCKHHLQKLLPMFYLQHNAPIERMLYTHLHVDSSEESRKALKRLREARILIGYFYSSPHFPGGDPFLLHEHADFYLFEPGMVSKFLVGMADDDTELDSGSPPEPNRFEVEGYEGTLNQHSWVWVAEGSRLYPSLPHFWLNKSQDLSRDLELLQLQDYTWPLLHLVLISEAMHQESEERVFTALEWYNRSSSGHASEEVALVHLATAFESLLGLEQGPDLTTRFKDTVLCLLGKTPLLDSWIEQFYRARSKILHEGYWPHLAFYATDRKSYQEILKGKQEGTVYRKLTSYGRRVFRLCLNTLIAGAVVAKETKLHSLFVHNQERLESICRQLNQENVDPAQRIRQVAQDILDLHDYWLESKNVTQIETVLGAGKLLITVYLETKPQVPSEITSALEAILQQDNSASEFDQLKLFEQLARQLERWKGGRISPGSIPPSDLTNVLRLYVDYASMPGFLLRSQGYNI